jgi:hypothetical protein
MFLTQEHLGSFIAVDGDLTREIGSEETLWQNVAVFQQIEHILEDYPEHPYQAAFSIAELRQKLVNHVLSHLPKRYSGIDDAQKSATEAKLPYRIKQERIRLDVLIRGSILHLLRENADWVSRRLQRMESSGNNTLESLSSKTGENV